VNEVHRSWLAEEGVRFSCCCFLEPAACNGRPGAKLEVRGREGDRRFEE